MYSQLDSDIQLSLNQITVDGVFLSLLRGAGYHCPHAPHSCYWYLHTVGEFTPRG